MRHCCMDMGDAERESITDTAQPTNGVARGHAALPVLNPFDASGHTRRCFASPAGWPSCLAWAQVGPQLFPRFLGSPLRSPERAIWGSVLAAIGLVARLIGQPLTQDV